MPRRRSTCPPGVAINAPILPGFETILTPAGARASSPSCTAPSSRAARSCSPRASSAPSGSTPASGPTSSPRRRRSATATGRSRRCRRRCTAAASRSPARSTRKMVINAFNSGADSYMTDFEDSNSPIWDEPDPGPDQHRPGDPPHALVRAVVAGGHEGVQAQRQDRHAAGAPARLAPRREARDWSTASACPAASSTSRSSCSTTPRSCSRAAPARTSTCPRSRAISRRACGTTSSCMTQNELGLPQGTIKATVLIETILAAFEMDEILYELREHSRRPQRRPLGLHLQLHQEVQAATATSASPTAPR